MSDPRCAKEWTDAMKRHYNQPPPVPADRMWARIDQAREARRGRSRWRRWTGDPWLTRVKAAAAILVLGLAIGRMTTVSGPKQSPQAVGPREAIDLTLSSPAGGPSIYDLAVVDLFSRADLLLTGFQFATCESKSSFQTPAWAGGMLLQTRLLLDTPLAEDASTKALLEDLELVLAQIVGLSAENCVRDLTWIRQGLREHATLDRLRLAVVNHAPQAVI